MLGASSGFRIGGGSKGVRRVVALGGRPREIAGDGSSVRISRKSVYFCTYTGAGGARLAAYLATTRGLPDTCIINARDDESGDTRARVICAGEIKREGREYHPKVVLARGKEVCAVMCTPEGVGKETGISPSRCRGERKKGGEEDIGERKSCRVTDAESRGNDYFFIF